MQNYENFTEKPRTKVSEDFEDLEPETIEELESLNEDDDDEYDIPPYTLYGASPYSEDW